MTQELIERLRKSDPFVNDPVSLKPRLRNPDGPEAADTIVSLQARVAELEETQQSFMFLCKWIERAKFDDAVSASDALDVILHSPAMPWKNGRWDVDHKPYAEAFYSKFPAARTSQG